MINHWKIYAKNIIFIASLCFTLKIASFDLVSNQTLESSITPLTRSEEIPIPADGDCLYKSIMVTYLLPVMNTPEHFNARLAKLIGEDTIIQSKETKTNEEDSKDDIKVEINQMWDTPQLRQNFLSLRRSTFGYCLRQYPFPQLVSCMKSHIGIRDKVWGGSLAIQKIADKLQINIEEYTPNPEDNNLLTLLTRIQPKQKKTLQKIRIVRDNPTEEEVMNLIEDKDMQCAKVLSSKASQQRQHYRALLDQAVLSYLQAQQAKHNLEKYHIISKINIPNSLNELRWSPSAYECAVLSKHVYRYNLQKNKQVMITIGKKENARKIKLPDWSVYQILENEEGSISKSFKKIGVSFGYKGIIYCNDSKKQLVLAHCITNFWNIDSLTKGALSTANNIMGGEERLLPSKLATLVNILKKEKNGYAVAITGHSLGGWLAQLTLFIGKSEYPHYFWQAITFDAPGIESMLKEMKQHNNQSIPDLNITNYLSSPNLVNTVNSYIFTAYRVVFKKFSQVPLTYTKESHDLVNFIDAFNPKTGEAWKIHRVDDWPRLSTKEVEEGSEKFSDLFGLSDLSFLKKMSSIFNFLYYCKKAFKDKQLLGEYTEFFKFATYLATHQYDLAKLKLPPGEDFDLTYKCHYKAHVISPSHDTIHKRHLSQKAYELIKNSYHREMKYSNALRAYGLEVFLKAQYKSNSSLIHVPKGDQDIRCLVDGLETLVNALSLAKLASSPAFQDSTMPEYYITMRKPLQINGQNNMGLPYTAEDLEKGRFIPRHDKIKAIKKQFDTMIGTRRSRVVFLVADGGMGKTTLAELYANDSYKKGRYKHVWMIQMEEETSQNSSVFEITNRLGIGTAYHYRPNDKERKSYLKKTLEENTGWLLILDNVEEGTQRLEEFLKIEGGHILITTRYKIDMAQFSKTSSFLAWYQDQGSDSLRLNESDGIALLTHFHQPTDSHENICATHIVERAEGLPLALATIGYYIENNKSDTIYKEYLDKLKKLKIKDPLKKIFYITREKINKQLHALRLLRVMAYFDADGVDIHFFKYLRPSRKKLFIRYSRFVQDKGKTINHKEAENAWKILRNYGMVSQEKTTFKTHRCLQSIIRNDVVAKKIAPYIQDQGVQLLETIHEKSVEHSGIIKFNMLRHIHSVISYTGKDVVYRCRLLSLLSQIEHTDILKSDLYLPPQASNGQELHSQVDDFIHKSKKKLMLITGEAGAGKSAYAAYLLRKTWKEYDRSSGWKHYAYIPLFISLPGICTDEKLAEKGESFDLVAQALAQKGLKEEAIHDLRNRVNRKKEHLLLILDSFDEVSKTINQNTENVYKKYELSKWFSSSTKVIITCRTSYLKDHNTTQLFDCKGVKHHEIAIASFSKDQIDVYIKRFANSSYNDTAKYYPPKWDEKKYNAKLANFPTLKEMMNRPFMLVLGLRALPPICEKKLQDVTLHTVYEVFTQQWFQREKGKFKNRNIKGIEKKMRTFCEELAFEMFRQGKYCIEKKDSKKIDEFLHHSDTFQSAPLRQVRKGVYAFLQPSYRDFFAAPLIIKKRVLKNHITPKSLNHELVLFLTKEIHQNQDQTLEASLWEYLKKASKEKGVGIAVACCLQLLYAMNPKSLENQDLSGINLQDGKLSGLDLSSVKLTGANLSGQNLLQVKISKNLSNCNLTDANLSGKNLTGYSFSNANLNGANLSDANLTDVILTNTTCDYQKAFEKNSKKNKLQIQGSKWCQDNLPKDLQSIALVYPNINHHPYKVKLLQIASAFSLLPFCESTEFYIKVQYWSSELLLLKQSLDSPYAQQLICSLQSDLESDAKQYCWTTDYPQNKISIHLKASHNNFDSYLKEFKNGLTQYQCQSVHSDSFDWYKKEIIQNIEGLAVTYPHIKEAALQQQACDIAHALSKSYQVQGKTFLYHYLFFQNKLIWLKKSIGIGMKNKVYYNHKLQDDLSFTFVGVGKRNKKYNNMHDYLIIPFIG